jgi:hypothetical protein
LNTKPQTAPFFIYIEQDAWQDDSPILAKKLTKTNCLDLLSATPVNFPFS